MISQIEMFRSFTQGHVGARRAWRSPWTARAMLATLLLLCTALPNARVLYPTTPALTTGTLAVSNVHSLYYQVPGNPNGEPALFLPWRSRARLLLATLGLFRPEILQDRIV